MKERNILILITGIIAILLIPGATAATVDGINSPGEWDDRWAACQINVGDPIFPYGDRLELEQGGFVHTPTGVFYEEDPQDDSGPGFDDSMAHKQETLVVLI